MSVHAVEVPIEYIIYVRFRRRHRQMQRRNEIEYYYIKNDGRII